MSFGIALSIAGQESLENKMRCEEFMDLVAGKNGHVLVLRLRRCDL
jgi:hypothetical protein